MQRQAIMSFLLLFVLLLGACAKNEVPEQGQEQEYENPKSEPTQKTFLQTLETMQQTFHFVAGWLSNEKIVYVEKQHSNYLLKTFNIKNGEEDELYQSTSMMTNVLIHPTKQYLLIHTSSDHLSAELKMINLEGDTIHKIELASSEIEVEWNENDANKFLITTFYEDWSYDTFFYNGHDNELSRLELGAPFLKWYGEDKIVYLEEAIQEFSTGNLMSYSMETADTELLQSEVLFFSIENDVLVTAQMIDNQVAILRAINLVRETELEWTISLVDNGFDWMIPSLTVLNDQTILSYEPNLGNGEFTDKFQLVKLNNAGKEVLFDQRFNETLICSDDGVYCLVGPAYGQLLDLETLEEQVWLKFREE